MKNLLGESSYIRRYEDSKDTNIEDKSGNEMRIIRTSDPIIERNIEMCESLLSPIISLLEECIRGKIRQL